MASTKLAVAAAASIMTTDLNSLATGQSNLSAAYDNGTNLYIWGDFELLVTFGVAPTAGWMVDMYLAPAVDGSNYADSSDGASPVTSGPNYIGGYPLRAVTSAQRIVIRGIPLPPCSFKIMLVNNSGQSMAASGNTLKMLPYYMTTV
jgi:hypothetical protein